ncbi:unnamed protein product [Alopecurus aequalis]
MDGGERRGEFHGAPRPRPPQISGEEADIANVGSSFPEDGSEKCNFGVRIGKASPDRVINPDRKSALEISIRSYVDRKEGTVIDPAVGTTFDSLEEAYKFYNLYSWETGFGIKYAKSRLNVHRVKCMQEIVCGCAGNLDKENNRSARCGCTAMIRLLRTEYHGWHITEHRSTHNHRLSRTCGEKLHWQSHRHIDKYTRDLVKHLRENNVSLSKVYNIIGSFFGSMENVPFTKSLLKHLCSRLNMEQADNDAKKTTDIFAEMKANDPDFNYTVQVEDESRVKTLITNLYDMPFGLFVGVNNHFQSIIFGGVMMRDERKESFDWVFKEFVRMVGGKPPKTILTDQARAMEQDAPPNTVHRWCKWHVLRKAKESLGAVYGKRSDFKYEFHKLVHHMIMPEEFEDGWMQMLANYSLQKHLFLTQIYEVRHKWAKPFFRGVFCAKMTRTQRIESANHLLKSYVPPGCPMHLFVRQYEKLQFDQDSEESYQEKRTSIGGVVLKQNIAIERHTSKIYTRALFDQFSNELYKVGSYDVKEVEKGEIFMVQHIDASSREKWSKVEYKVEIDGDFSVFKCECEKFNHSGLVCCHALKVRIAAGLQRIPERHIVKRWTRNARDILPDDLVRYQKDQRPPKSVSFRHSKLYIKALECVQLGDSNVKSYEVGMALLDEVIAKLKPFWRGTEWG